MTNLADLVGDFGNFRAISADGSAENAAIVVRNDCRQDCQFPSSIHFLPQRRRERREKINLSVEQMSAKVNWDLV